MSTIPARSRSPRLVLQDIDWKTYVRLVNAFAEKPRVRLTYDRGRLEILSPLIEHEGDADFLGLMVLVLTSELKLPRRAGGSSTLRRRSARKGLEPDRCFWLANEAAIRGKKRLDLRVDPPPDLAIEVDVTSSSLGRMAIYAALNIPEVWRLEDDILTFQILSSGEYTPAPQSRAFPFVTPADLMSFLAMRINQDETSVEDQFRLWVRQKIAATRTGP